MTPVDLAAVRRARGRTQQELAATAGWQQEAVSRLERRLGAAKLATMKRYVESLGGELRIMAVFRGEQFEVDIEEGRGGRRESRE